VREQFCVAIAPYVLDGDAAVAEIAARTEAAVLVQGKKVHGKRRASERLSSSPAARGLLRAPKRARLGSSPDHGEDGDAVKKEEESEAHRGVRHLDLAAKYRSIESKRRGRER
jgi:hypothetical protein